MCQTSEIDPVVYARNQKEDIELKIGELDGKDKRSDWRSSGLFRSPIGCHLKGFDIYLKSSEVSQKSFKQERIFCKGCFSHRVGSYQKVSFYTLMSTEE
jgi:hypothetical protein